MAGANGEPTFVEGVWYDVEVVAVRDAVSRNKGTPYLEFTFRVTAGEMADEEITYEMYATEGRREATYRELEVLGFKATPDADWDGLKEFLIGRVCAVTLKSENWKGRDRMKVDQIRAQRAGGVIEQEPIQQFASVFGGRVMPKTRDGKDKGAPF